MGYEPWLNQNNTCTFPCTFVKCEEQQSRRKVDEKAERNIVAADVKEFVGTYSNSAYGTVTVTPYLWQHNQSTDFYRSDQNTLAFAWNELSGPMKSTATDTFLLQLGAIRSSLSWPSIGGPVTLDRLPMPIHFGRNFEGNVDSLNAPFEPTTPPIVFTKLSAK